MASRPGVSLLHQAFGHQLLQCPGGFQWRHSCELGRVVAAERRCVRLKPSQQYFTRCGPLVGAGDCWHSCVLSASGSYSIRAFLGAGCLPPSGRRRPIEDLKTRLRELVLAEQWLCYSGCIERLLEHSFSTGATTPKLGPRLRTRTRLDWSIWPNWGSRLSPIPNAQWGCTGCRRGI